MDAVGDIVVGYYRRSSKSKRIPYSKLISEYYPRLVRRVGTSGIVFGILIANSVTSADTKAPKDVRSSNILIGTQKFTVKQFKNQAVFLRPSELKTAASEMPLIFEGFVGESIGKDCFVLNLSHFDQPTKDVLNVDLELLSKRNRKPAYFRKGQLIWVYGWILPREEIEAKKTARDFKAVIVEKPNYEKALQKVQLAIEEINPPAVRRIVPNWNVRVTVRNDNSFAVDGVQGQISVAIQQPKDDRETVGVRAIDIGRIEANSVKSLDIQVNNQSRLAFVPTFEGQIVRAIPVGKGK